MNGALFQDWFASGETDRRDGFGRRSLGETGSASVRQTHPKKDRDEITVAKPFFDEIVEFTEETPKKSAPAKPVTPEPKPNT